MSSTYRLLARFVVVMLLFGVLPVMQSQTTSAQDTATYTGIKYDCAPGYDPGSGDANAAFANCTTPAAGVSFTLQSGDASYAGGTQQSNGGGSVSWNGIPLGVGYSVSESVPDGYGTPWVYCEVTGDPNYPGDVQRSFFAASGGNMDVGYSDPSLTSYTQATCYWFNTPPAQNGNGQTQQYQGGGTAVVKIQKYYCDDSSYDYNSFTYANYQSNCPDYHNGVEFSVNNGSHSSTGNNNGTVEFGSLPAGNADIRLHEADGYYPQVIYCVSYPNGQNAPTIDESHKQTWTDEGNNTYRLTLNLQDGYTYYCAWYDFYESSPNVYIYKYYCDQGYEWSSGSYEDLYAECTSWQPGVSFEVHNGSYSEGQTTDENGRAWWTDVPSGTLEFTEQVPSGYQIGRIFCGVAAQNDGTEPTSWTEYFYSDGWQVDLPEGQYLHCFVFNIPADYGTIYLYKYYCPPEFDWQGGGYDYLLSGCGSYPHTGISFEVSQNGYQEEQSTDSSGTATWTDVPTGTVTIAESVPDGFVVGKVYCGYSTDGSTIPTSWDEYTYQDGMQAEVQSGQYLFCVLFDIPSDYGTVYFYKYYCHPDYEWTGGSYDDLYANCTTPHENVYFEANGDGYSQGQTTDSSGYATWTDVPYGNLFFTEDVPDGYQVGRIWCGYSDTEGVPPTSWDEYFYSDGWEVPYSTGYLYCYVFDVPDDYGTIYFYKYYCAPDFDWQSNGYDYLLSSCTTPHENVYFEAYNGGYTAGQTTDSSGAATWTDVPWGDLSFYEEVPDGYQVGRIFCGYSEQEGTPPTSYDEYFYNGGWDVPTPPGKYLYCYVFDVPYDYGTVYLYKYYCAPDFDWESNGYDYMLSGCTTPHEGIYVEINGDSYTQGQTTDSSGYATWGDAPYGNLVITVQEAEGYQVGRIFCGYSEEDGVPPTSWEEYDRSSEWNVEYLEGQYLYCYVFDVPYEYGTIWLYKYYCEPDFDWQGGGYDYLLSECDTPHENVYFEVNSGGYSEGQSTDNSGAASWTDAPYGDLVFTEDIPDGYQVGRIWCGYSDSEGTPPTSWDEYFYSDGWEVPYTTGYLYCYVFDVPYDYGTIWLYKYYCEPGFDWHSAGYDYLLSECDSPHENIYFEVHSGSYSQGQSTDSSGAALWSDAPYGDLQIVEDVPDGYQVGRIFCGYSDEEGVPPTSWDEYFYGDGYDVSWHEGQYLYCYVFDVPYEYGTVYIYKYYCAPDFDWQSNGYDYLLSECSSPQSGVYFEIESGSYVEGQSTDGSGTASWEEVQAGSLTIYEQPPSGYQVGRIFCGVVAQNAGTLPSTWEEYDYADGWHVDLPEGQYLHCYVFDVPAEYGWVTVWKYTCPQDYDYGTYDLSYYESNCTERPEGVEFDLYNDPYDYQQTQATDSSGVASWSDVPSGGELYFWEVPNGYTPIAVYCGVSSDGSEPSSWDEYTLDSDGALSGLWVEPEQYLYCKWFNKPYDNPQVWIYKYNCDESAQWNWAYHQLLSQCDTYAPGVEFGYAPQGSEPVLTTTDDQGKWLYEDLAPGVWYWEETYPSGYSGAVVYCQWVGSYGSGDYQQATLSGSTLWLDVDYGDVVTCYWFDFPTGHEPPAVTPTSGGSGGSGSSGGSGGSGTSGGSTSGGTGGTGGPPPLTSNAPTGPKTGGPVGGGSTTQPGNPNAPATLIIVKRTCPQGFDLYAENADVEKDCSDLTQGVDFGLTDLSTADAEPVDQTTGEDGKATWTNLKAGPYLIVETLPEDTYSAFIWTCKSDKRQFQLQFPFTPFSYAGPVGEIGITLIAGEKLECAWYDVPTAPVEVTVLKFECPSSPVIVAQCSPAGAGVAFNLTPAGGAVGAIIQLTTDESGSASGSGTAGTYTLAEQGGSPCLIDSESMNEEGNVVLEPGEPAEVRVYNCGGGGS